MSLPAKQPTSAEVIEQVVIAGDLAVLTAEQRVVHYNKVCESLGINPLTKPFDYIVLNGKMQLYPLRTCADQLRKINDVSLEIVSRDLKDNILTIHVRAKMANGRSDEDLGAVAMIYPDRMKTRDGWKDHPKAGKPLEGDDRVNAELKAITKAKRRTTLSICGLGWIDETEIETIPASAKRPAPPAANVMLPLHDKETGEIIEKGAPEHQPEHQPAPLASSNPAQNLSEMGEEASETNSEEIAKYDEELASAAETGDLKALQSAWKLVPRHIQPALKSALDRRHKPRAAEVGAMDRS
jgi:hypothetical protein